MMKHPLRSLSWLIAAALVSACSTQDDPAQALSTAKVTLADAILKAKEKAGGGAPVEAELLMLDGKPVFEIDLRDGDGLKEVTIDALSGTAGPAIDVPVSEKERVTLEAFDKLDKNQRLGLMSAVEQAERETANGRCIEVDLELIDGDPTFEIRLLADGVGKRVLIPVGKGR